MIPISMWTDMQGKCPQCHLLLDMSAEACPHCGHEFTQNEMSIMQETASVQFKRNFIFGAVFFVLLFGIVIWIGVK